MTIPLSLLIEASECLKMAKATAPAGAYIRFLDAQFKLEVEIDLVLKGLTVEVTAAADRHALGNEAHKLALHRELQAQGVTL